MQSLPNINQSLLIMPDLESVLNFDSLNRWMHDQKFYVVTVLRVCNDTGSVFLERELHPGHMKYKWIKWQDLLGTYTCISQNEID